LSSVLHFASQRTISGHYYAKIKKVSTFAICISNQNAYNNVVMTTELWPQSPKWQDHLRRVQYGRTRKRLTVTYATYIGCLAD